jgi:uncharacterized protein
MNTDCKEYSEKYKQLLEKAIALVKINIENDSYLKDIANDFLDMSKNYLKDGKHFQEKEDYARALAAFSYAYAWIDSGVRLGLFYGVDRSMFTLYK